MSIETETNEELQEDVATELPDREHFVSVPSLRSTNGRHRITKSILSRLVDYDDVKEIQDSLAEYLSNLLLKDVDHDLCFSLANGVVLCQFLDTIPGCHIFGWENGAQLKSEQARHNLFLFDQTISKMGVKSSYFLYEPYFLQRNVKKIIDTLLLLCVIGKKKGMKYTLPFLEDKDKDLKLPPSIAASLIISETEKDDCSTREEKGIFEFVPEKQEDIDKMISEVEDIINPRTILNAAIREINKDKSIKETKSSISSSPVNTITNNNNNNNNNNNAINPATTTTITPVKEQPLLNQENKITIILVVIIAIIVEIVTFFKL
ncbi:hypothetical protein WA158_004570 [Blastocystis sp. Blastoise]